MDIKNRIIKQRVHLLLDHPFYGNLALGLKMIEDEKIPTMCTDGTEIRYNPDFSKSLKDEDLMFVIAHEILHVALAHPLRMQDRNPLRWNFAVDFAVNAIL